MLAIQARTIMSAHGKKPIDPVKAFKLKDTDKKEKKKTNADESKRMVQDLEKEMGVVK
jgi:hypothetical protein